MADPTELPKEEESLVSAKWLVTADQELVVFADEEDDSEVNKLGKVVAMIGRVEKEKDGNVNFAIFFLDCQTAIEVNWARGDFSNMDANIQLVDFMNPMNLQTEAGFSSFSVFLFFSIFNFLFFCIKSARLFFSERLPDHGVGG
jgi:hypothetical protein